MMNSPWRRVLWLLAALFVCAPAVAALALQTPAAVRTLGLVEVVFAQLVSWRLLRERISRREVTGLALLGVALVILLRR